MSGAPDPAARVVACQGAPRDLGLDQGAACAALLAERGAGRAARPAGGAGLARLAAALRAAGGLRRAAPDAECAAVARDLERHFPQLAERLDGLARGAGVARGELVLALRAELGAAFAGELSLAPGTAVALRRARGAPPALIVATLARGAAVPRRSRPENGLRSLEWVAPWGVGGLAGVNEAGLAAAWAPAAAPARTWPRCAAPASLLVQECLQRFSDVPGATAWCRSRPAGGAACVVLADARGAVAEVAIDGDRRSVRVADGGGALASPGPAAEALVTATKTLLEAAANDAVFVAALGAVRAAADAAGTPAAVLLDPAARETIWSDDGATLLRLAV